MSRPDERNYGVAGAGRNHWVAGTGRKYLVVGAGISGLYAALLLARAGRRVRVIERSGRSGGLAGAEVFRGIPCDLGSHRLHPQALDRPLFREIHGEEPLLERPRRGALVLGDRRVPYPPSALALARGLGPTTSLKAALGALRALRAREEAGASSGWERGRAPRSSAEDVGFERFIIARVGEAAYRAFYRPYAEKVWGIDPADLSQSVAKKRVSGVNPLAIVKGLAGRAAAAMTARPRVDLGSFVYPRGGASSITGFLEGRLKALGVTVEIGQPFEAREAQGEDVVLFAGDLAALTAADDLQHRGLYLVYLALPTPKLAEEETYYCPESKYCFGRVSELQNYSPDLRRPGETILCVEIPEGAWGRGVDFASGARLDALLDQLAEARIVPRHLAPIEVMQRFVPNVYPLYRRGWIRSWRRAMAEVAKLGNVIPFGRQALFLHINLDQCADIAEDAVAFAETSCWASGRTDLEPWIRRAERYLELTVRD